MAVDEYGAMYTSQGDVTRAIEKLTLSSEPDYEDVLGFLEEDELEWAIQLIRHLSVVAMRAETLLCRWDTLGRDA